MRGIGEKERTSDGRILGLGRRAREARGREPIHHHRCTTTTTTTTATSSFASFSFSSSGYPPPGCILSRQVLIDRDLGRADTRAPAQAAVRGMSVERKRAVVVASS